MSKLLVNVNVNDTYKQIANMLNKYNSLQTTYTPSMIASNNVSYLIELGGINERCKDGNRKVVGFIGLSHLNNNTTLIKHLCVDPFYRNQGVATKLLTTAIECVKMPYIQMRVRSDNWPSLYLAEKMKFVYVYHYVRTNYSILVLGRPKQI